jgi:ABC-type polysaccharide/polyol phosphate transport system ATPase subunit
VIELRGVSLRFTTYNDKYYSLKRACIDLFLRRDVVNQSAFWALSGIDLRIGRGERVGVLGANGAGKSTLLRVLAGIYPPSGGTLKVRGRVAPLIEMGAGFNYELSGEDNVFLNGALLGFDRRQMRARLDRIWEFSGLREFSALPLKYYSSGMLSRLSFAIATEVEPDILLLDETLSVGDATFKAKAHDRIMSVIDRSNVVIVVSHDMDALARICTRGVWIDRGVVQADGPIKEVIARYHRHVGAVPPARKEQARDEETAEAA